MNTAGLLINILILLSLREREGGRESAAGQLKNFADITSEANGHDNKMTN